jgi:predicted metal-dependent peptidase
MTIEERIGKTRYNLFIKQPYLGYILQHIPFIERTDIQTAATEGFSIFYNKEFMENLSDDALEFVILHELLHIILAHPSRGIGKDNQKFNVACDIVVNDILTTYQFSYAELEPILGKKYKLNGNRLTAEMIYDRLKTNVIKIPFDSHDLWRELSHYEKSKLKDILRKAKKEFGTYSSVQSLKENFFFNEPSRLPWQRIFDKLLMHDLHDYSFQKIDTRFGNILLPTYIPSIETLKEIWVVIDASGSMQDELNNVINECANIVKQFPQLDIKVSYFSNIVTEPLSVKKINDFKETTQTIQTTGGTSFNVIFEKIDTFFPYKKPKSILIMTDGYAEYPDVLMSKGISVIWLITDKHQKPTFGKVYYLE